MTIKINKIDAAYEHTPINSFNYQYSEQIRHIRLYLKLVLTYVHFGLNKIINCALFWYYLILTNAVNIKRHFTCKYCTKHLDNSLTDQ